MKRILTLLAFAALFAGGCEKSDSNDFYIRASREKLCNDERCELLALLSDKEYDNIRFSWSLSNPSIGHLSDVHGRHAEYVPTSFPAPGEPELVQTIRCKVYGSILEGDFSNLNAHIKITHFAGPRK